LKVLFLSADTGGGHRASAESLANQFVLHYPGTKYDLLDVWTTDGILPYRTLVPSYQHLSAHPRQWRFLYHLSNSRPWEIGMDWHSTITCERKIRRRIESYNPDVIVSVHPAMNYAPLISTRKISEKMGRHIPFFTVVSDLGSGHCTWFQKDVDKLYLASERLRRLAKRRGRLSDDKIVMTGLPIRRDFALQAERLGDRTSEPGKSYQSKKKEELNLDPNRPVVLVMGGGEGVGSLSKITVELYKSFTNRGVNATICVVCGRNEKLKNELASMEWIKAATTPFAKTYSRKFFSRIPGFFRRKNSMTSPVTTSDPTNVTGQKGCVNVVGLGFVTNMADYMVAADVLVTKAGPGTIAEAASLGLPVMLTSFLPGQEAGNVDYVMENGFGDFDRNPVKIGEKVAIWLQDPILLQQLSKRSLVIGQPQAAQEIVLDIGQITQTWKVLNGDVKKKEKDV
jgi:1,2-diacylglycerol 3-beta-galactosyltransferase